MNDMVVIGLYLTLFGALCFFAGMLYRKKKQRKWIEIKKKHVHGVYNPKKDELLDLEGANESFFE